MKNLIKLIVPIYFLVAFISSNNSYSQAQNCEELIYYRDVELFKEFDKAVTLYKINSDAIAQMKQIKQETLNERQWNKLFSVNTAMSDEGLATAIFAKNIQIYCKLIRSSIDLLNPKSGVISTADHIYKTLKLGENIKSIVSDDVEKIAYKKILTLQNPLTKAITIAWEYSDGMQEMVKMPEERDKLRIEVKRIMDMLDTSVNNYQQELRENSNKINDLNETLKGITLYLAENCKKNIPLSKKITPKTKSITTSPKSAIEPKKNVRDSFFIFLSANFTINGKDITILSQPIEHSGKITDAMINHKEDFIKSIELQMEEKPNRYKEELMKDNFKNIVVHYGKPYSTILLKSLEDGYNAIDEFKLSQQEIYEGTNYNFVQLK